MYIHKVQLASSVQGTLRNLDKKNWVSAMSKLSHIVTKITILVNNTQMHVNQFRSSGEAYFQDLFRLGSVRWPKTQPILIYGYTQHIHILNRRLWNYRRLFRLEVTTVNCTSTTNEQIIDSFVSEVLRLAIMLFKWHIKLLPH